VALTLTSVSIDARNSSNDWVRGIRELTLVSSLVTVSVAALKAMTPRRPPTTQVKWFVVSEAQKKMYVPLRRK
jgi:hypothetical protein